MATQVYREVARRTSERRLLLELHPPPELRTPLERRLLPSITTTMG